MCHDCLPGSNLIPADSKLEQPVPQGDPDKFDCMDEAQENHKPYPGKIATPSAPKAEQVPQEVREIAKKIVRQFVSSSPEYEANAAALIVAERERYSAELRRELEGEREHVRGYVAELNRPLWEEFYAKGSPPAGWRCLVYNAISETKQRLAATIVERDQLRRELEASKANTDSQQRTAIVEMEKHERTKALADKFIELNEEKTKHYNEACALAAEAQQRVSDLAQQLAALQRENQELRKKDPSYHEL